ncbi:hypothetical protein D8674_031676 [Pyrus ussuriensis x Pyrus communis]|uniref:Uncharacterized protein n=1 Tax=Pyrus ussuriensis x Pyrus communis TaxID=2448454 RepID=A0A5N5EZN0_9ROSA|nr:hypothetical protein D8674_031676 [Pyrus ussuriensis x Pyrus communis]
MRSKQKKFEFWPFCLQPGKLFAIKDLGLGRSILQTASITCLGTQLATISAASIFLVIHQKQSSHGLKRMERQIQGNHIALAHQT